MVDANSTQIKDEFIEAKNNWDLEKLYIDLASAKGKALTPVEKKFLRGLLCGCSPAEIASIVYKSRSSSTVRVYLSNGLYKYIEEMLSNQAGYSIKVKNWSRVTHLLDKAGYKKNWFQLEASMNPIKILPEQETDLFIDKSTQIQDWGEAIDVSEFHGRRTELTTVKEWILSDRCRLVIVLGMGGIGKTAFSIKFSEEIQSQFTYVIWRSLRSAPSIKVILNQFLEILAPNQPISQTQTLDDLISQLIDCLRASRCLLILDNFDAILCNSDANETQLKSIYNLSQIHYHQGYEGYGELIRRVGDSQHQSSMLLTSREKPPEIVAIEGEKLPVRSLKLTGLSYENSLMILKSKGFSELEKEEYKALIDWYTGNPLFIKLVATTIQDVFAGNISKFIKQGTVVFGEIRRILDQQFNRLSELEKQMLYCLVINPDYFSVQNLPLNILSGLSHRLLQRLILEAIELLQKRSLIDKAPPTQTKTSIFSFSLSPVLMEYVIERLIEENFKLNDKQANKLLINHTILVTPSNNYD
jgi:hypothetical protein